MATRDIVVRVRAEIASFRKDMDAAAAKAKETAQKTEAAGKTAESGIGRLAQTAKAHEKAWSQVSTGMVAGGTAIVGALGISTKAAMDWESAFTGVKKTVDGTPAQLAKVESGLRGLAKTLPSTHAEIAGVAEAAGQLGVARDDVVGFTKTMIDLGESTNLTAEDAATNIAQISNVMGTMDREGTAGVERFGSALVALGNDGASTEAEILSMAQRIAGAGATIGATEADVLALSNTLASMGVRAELGGGVTTRVLLKMRSAVDEGGEALQAFADVAGMSMDEFAAKFRSAPVEALDLVSKGIYRVNEAGGNVTATLKDMGIKGTEETQVMLALANSGDLLADSLKLGATAWEENSALAKEAGERYKTAESKVRIAWNNIKDAAIDAGSAILPAVATIAESVADMVNAWQQLPGPVKSAVSLLGGVAGVALLAGGAFMKLAPTVVGTVNGLRDLAGALRKSDDGLGRHVKGASGTVGAMSKMEKAALGVAAAYTAIATAAAIASDARAGFDKDIDSSEIVNALTDIAGKGDEAYEALDKVFNGSVVTGGGSGPGGAPTAVNDLATAMDRLFNRTGFDKFNDFLGTWVPGVESGSEIVRKNFVEMDAALVELSNSGKFDDAAAGFKRVMDSAVERGAEVQDVIDMFPQYRDAAYQALTANGETQVSQERLIEAMLNGLPAGEAAAQGLTGLAGEYTNLSGEVEKAMDRINDFYDDMINKGMVVIGENEAIRRLQESINSASETIKENGKVVKENGDAIDQTSAKYLSSAAALDGIASSTLSVIEPMRAAGAGTAEMAAQIALGRQEFIAQARDMGYGQKAAEAYADKLNLIPGAVYVQFNSNVDDLGGKLYEIHELVQSTPDGQVTITENSPEVKSALEALGYIVTELPDGKIKVSETGTDETGKKIDKTAGKKRTAKITAEAATSTAESVLNTAARTRTATIIASVIGGPLGSVVGAAAGAIGRKDGGRLPGLDTGGRLPATGLGTDKILAVNAAGVPIARVDDREWVVNRRSSDKHDELLAMINRDDPRVDMMKQLVGLAGGGRVGAAEKRVQSLQRAYSRISGDKANRARKLAAKDQLDAAKAELKAAKAAATASKKQAEEAKKRAKEAAERRQRVGELRADTRRDIRRGDVLDSFTSGGGLSQVDKLIGLSRNDDLSRGARNRALKDANRLESSLLRLDRQSESLEKRLDKATEARDRLLEVSKSVSGGLRGEYSLGNVLSNLLSGDQKGPLAASSFVKSAQGKAAQIRRFGGVLAKLRKKGYSEAVIQEVAELGTVEGTQVGNALLGATGKERDQLNAAYKSMDYWAGQAGVEVTKAMRRGGIDSAQGLVDGLQSKKKDVENAFYRLGKDAEKSFRRSLDMHSPSRTLAVAGVDSMDGIIVGAESRRKALTDTYASMGDTVQKAFQPALTVPPSPEVSRYASAQALSPAISAEAIAAAVQAGMAGWQPMVQIDGRKFYGTMQQVTQQYSNRR